MPKHNGVHPPDDDQPPRKKSGSLTSQGNFKKGAIIKDITGKQWKLGKILGFGAFGKVYAASEYLCREVKTESSYVTKIETHSNGPLFTEINCYIRIAKQEMIEAWKHEQKLPHLGIPHYIASGSHQLNEQKYRFLVIPRFENDFENILKTKTKFNLKTVLTISIQIIDVLEYIHDHGYVHSDIKAGNIMLEKRAKAVKSIQPVKKVIKCDRQLRKRKKIVVQSLRKNLRPIGLVDYSDEDRDLDASLNEDEPIPFNPKIVKASSISENTSDRIYLVDYGLASKFLRSDGEHRRCEEDERRAHVGTLQFCSRDAHVGIISRRADLESLGYNMIYWLTGTLPWFLDKDEPELVAKKKKNGLRHVKSFISYCFEGELQYFLCDFFEYINKLQYNDRPDYDYCRNLFIKTLKSFGYKNDAKLDLDNETVSVPKVKKKAKHRDVENRGRQKFNFDDSFRPPLLSNVIFKRPKLRKKTNNNQPAHDSRMNWSKILINPEDIIKQGRERKVTENSDSSDGSLTMEDLLLLNPTYAMLNVFVKKSQSKSDSKTENCVNKIEGYTPNMMSVYFKMKEEEKKTRIAARKNNKRPKTTKIVEIKRSRGRPAKVVRG